MENYSERMTKMISIFRKRNDWINNHSLMKFGDKHIGYYDTINKGCYFTLKHAGVEVTHINKDRIQVDYSSWKIFESFDLNQWLAEIEKIVLAKTITLDGKEYLLLEL